MNIVARAAPRAYSYKRFSTPEQEKGDSLRRQTKAAQDWADRRGVALDTELDLTDPGISAYTGDNRDVGALGAFLEAVANGTVPKGSWLLVESLDRISREPAIDAAHTMRSIIRAGVTVVDLSDNAREYNLKSLRSDNGMSLMMMVMMFSRANNESATKGMRVAAAYANKRERLAGTGALDRPYTRRLPAWIRWDDEGKAYVLIEDRAQLLRKIFELTDEGWGQHRIANWLNRQKVETWGAGGRRAKYWHRSYVRKLLTNKAAIGVFVPHRMVEVEGKRKKQRAPLDAIPHLFPAVVDKALFERVADRLRTTGARGKNAGKPARSIFAGMIKCRYCDGTVTRVSKGREGYLVCSAANAKVGTCKYQSVPYQEAADALCTNIGHIIDNAPRGTNTAELERDIEKHQRQLDGTDQVIDDLLEAAITDKSRAARNALRDAEQKREEMAQALRTLRDRRDALAGTNVLTRLTAVESTLSQAPIDVEAANKALRAAVRKLVMRPQEGRLDILWHHADAPQETLFMTSRFDWDANQIEDAKEEEEH